MKITTNLLRVLGLLTAAFAMGTVPQAQGGGARIPDQSTRAMGMMDAFVAGADDASAVAYNPAGLTRLQVPEAIGNLYFAHADSFYTNGDTNQSSVGRYFTIPNFYLAAPLDAGRKNFLGLGVYTPFGLGSRWSEGRAQNWARAKTPTLLNPLPTALQESELQLVNINPTYARKITDRLSLGVGVDLYVSRIKQLSWSNLIALGPGLGLSKNSVDADGTGWGYNAGLQYDFTPQLTLGLTYRSKVTVDHDGSMDFENVIGNTTSDISAEITFPQSLAAGLCWKPGDRFRLEFTAEWMDWSEWDQREINVKHFPLPPPGGPQVITIPLDWHDSWILSLGGEYDLTEKWRLRAGYCFNETPVSKKLGDVDLPTGDTHGLSLGAGYQMSTAVTLDAALIVAYSEKRELNASSAPPGSDFWALSTYFSLGITYRF